MGYTIKCLQAIAANVSRATALEIILVNDCSTDQTKELLEPIEGLKFVNNQTNQGFIHSCNQGAAIAQGKYLYFLNNDTEIRPSCIESLVAVLADRQVGAVGSKLIYGNGTLQEAGGIIWQDASGWNYGRQGNADAPEYNYLRPVDYCSGASLMVRRDAFESLGGFERDFAPAYYEDTDLCFAVRHQLGLQVMYQPKSEVIHHEGISSGTSTLSGTKRYQVVNAAKFQQKWAEVLSTNSYLANQGITAVPLACRKYLGHGTILVIDSYMPCYDQESGSRRLFELLKIFKSLNYHVIFAADNGQKTEPYASVLANLQIEVLYIHKNYPQTIQEQLQQRLSQIDVAWICRPQLTEKYLPLIKQESKIKVVYDTIDLHYLRLQRAWQLSTEKSAVQVAQWQLMQQTELKMTRQADITITVTEIEQKVLQQQLDTGKDRFAVVPNVHLPYQGSIPSFYERSGILFIGSYNHPPNIDGVRWLCREIMPLVWQEQPNLKVTLLGSNVKPEVAALAEDFRVTVTGYIKDVSPYFLNHQLFVSPLRYGAGMKGKIGQSLEYSLPVVSTNIGTEGMNLYNEQHFLEANSTQEFAAQILRLHEDVSLWNRLSLNSPQAIAPYTPEVIKHNVDALMQRLLDR